VVTSRRGPPGDERRCELVNKSWSDFYCVRLLRLEGGRSSFFEQVLFVSGSLRWLMSSAGRVEQVRGDDTAGRASEGTSAGGTKCKIQVEAAPLARATSPSSRRRLSGRCEERANDLRSRSAPPRDVVSFLRTSAQRVQQALASSGRF